MRRFVGLWITIALLGLALPSCAEEVAGRSDSGGARDCGAGEQLFVESFTYGSDEPGYRATPNAAIADTLPHEDARSFELVRETADVLVLSDGEMTVKLGKANAGFRVDVTSRSVAAPEGGAE
jgi:hypothetical protein